MAFPFRDPRQEGWGWYLVQDPNWRRTEFDMKIPIKRRLLPKRQPGQRHKRAGIPQVCNSQELHTVCDVLTTLVPILWTSPGNLAVRYISHSHALMTDNNSRQVQNSLKGNRKDEVDLQRIHHMDFSFNFLDDRPSHELMELGWKGPNWKATEV